MRNTLKQSALSNMNQFPQFCESPIVDSVLITATQLATKLGCSLSYVKKLRSRGLIKPHIDLGRYVRYDYDCVVASLKRRGETT